MSKLDFKTLPEPASKYKMGLKIGGGVGGEIHEAVDNQTGKKVAIKVIDLEKEAQEEIRREHRVLEQFSGKGNFPEFYGIYGRKERDNVQKIWLVMEFCEGGDAASLVRKLRQENKRMSELHIAYILREAIKAVTALHESGTGHRDVRGSNVLLTADGRVKLVDYGISKRVDESRRMKTCIGSPGWLAPEVIKCQTEESDGYDQKADVWALGITAIELGDGRAPFEDVHPGRALFQIVNNPPPTLRKPSEWSPLYNDFVGECLVKDPENRPHVQELLLHPFFEPLDRAENLLRDLGALLEKYGKVNLYGAPEVQVRRGYVRTGPRTHPERILEEDLAAMARASEDSVLFQLHERFKKNESHTFVGDVLLILNSNRISDEYGTRHFQKYRFKAKSQNAPHIYSIADGAYRDVFHHDKPQHILFAGETGAGKTFNMKHATDHLLFLGRGLESSERVTKALAVIHVMGNAATPHNPDSTRHVLQMRLTFTDTGKTSGAVFKVCLLEKERVTMTSKKQANFHLLHCFFNALREEGNKAELRLEEGNYKLLKSEASGRNRAQDAARFRSFEGNLADLGFEEEHVSAVRKTLAAVLLIGEIEFLDDEDGNGMLATPDVARNAAALLGVDRKKLQWSLLNHCPIAKGEAVARRNSRREAEEATGALARGLYSRLVDWVVNGINRNISLSRIVYGDKHVVSLLDFYGFECYKKNALGQLFVNALNEQLQFHYNRQIFAWAKRSADEEGIPSPNLEWNDNEMVVDLIMSKPEGLLHKIDEATRNEDSSDFLGKLQTARGAPVFPETSREFSINHYTGKLTYDASDMVEKNRDFLPPEIIDAMRLSTRDIIKEMFSSPLSKSGNLSMQPKKQSANRSPAPSDAEGVGTTPSGQYSQTRQMRTAATTFKAACADLFAALTVRGSGFHFVRCLRTDLSSKPGAFDPEVVRQQLRALSVINTISITQQGYSYSASYEEFVRRYKFLAFDFDENVEETEDNCRLLLLRLKLEGWAMGKTKVFLKYFNVEYLSRLYETQIKKIVKVQSMMRAFVARRKLYAKIRKYQVDADEKKNAARGPEPEAEERAARIIQKRFREHAGSKHDLTEEEKAFLRPWCERWRTKSIFRVLPLRRAERLQALANFCLQIHLWNQNSLTSMRRTRGEIDVEDLNAEAEAAEFSPASKLLVPRPLIAWDDSNLRGNAAFTRESNERRTGLKRFEDKEIQTSFGKEDVRSRLANEEAAAISRWETMTNKQRPESDPRGSPSERRGEISDGELGEGTKPTVAGYAEEPQENPTTRRGKPCAPPSSGKSKSDPKGNAKRKFLTSIDEMEEKYRNEDCKANGDDPPFNFRALLKKTNPAERSRKSSREEFNFRTEIGNFRSTKKNVEVRCGEFGKPSRPSETIEAELAPGIVIRGKVTDL